MLPRWKREIPNWLTGSRVVLALVFFALLTPWRYADSPAAAGGVDVVLLAAAAIFVVAAVTDALDGILARRWNAVTAFGRIMDPFADKLLVVGAFVYLAGPGFTMPAPGEPGDIPMQVSGVYPWMVAVILGRELLVTSIRGALEGEGVAFPAGPSGKWKMILQSITVPLVLIVVAVAPVLPDDGRTPWGRWVVDVVVWATVIITVWSGVPYVTRAASATWPKRKGKAR